MSNNKTVLDLNKVQHGTFMYINQYGDTLSCIFGYPSVRGAIVKDEFAAYHPDYPGETMLERAKRLDLIDEWMPVVHFQLTANHRIVYTGKKATTMWKLWCAKIMNRKDKK